MYTYTVCTIKLAALTERDWNKYLQIQQSTYSTFTVMVCTTKLREHQQKTLITLSGFWSLRGWGSLSESVKKIHDKNLFYI